MIPSSMFFLVVLLFTAYFPIPLNGAGWSTIVTYIIGSLTWKIVIYIQFSRLT